MCVYVYSLLCFSIPDIITSYASLLNLSLIKSILLKIDHHFELITFLFFIFNFCFENLSNKTKKKHLKGFYKMTET